MINTAFQSLSISAENGESGQGSGTGNSFLKEKQEHLVQHSSRLQIWFIVDNGLGVIHNKLEPEGQALSVASFHRKTHRRGAALPSQMVGKDRIRLPLTHHMCMALKFHCPLGLALHSCERISDKNDL